MIVELGDRVPDEGTLRVTVRASRASDDDPRPASLRLMFGWQASNDSNAVFRAEVEDALYSHPAVQECAVIGIPSEQWGEAVHAVVVRKAGQSVSEADLVAHCKARIAGFKVPRYISFSEDELPKSGPGKILKADLRAPFWAGRDRAVN